MENELGVFLFYYSGRNIEIIVYVEEFYLYVVKILDILEEGIKLLFLVNEKIVIFVILYLEVVFVFILNLVWIFMEKYFDI